MISVSQMRHCTPILLNTGFENLDVMTGDTHIWETMLTLPEHLIVFLVFYGIHAVHALVLYFVQLFILLHLLCNINGLWFWPPPVGMLLLSCILKRRDDDNVRETKSLLSVYILIWICGLKHQMLYLLDEDFITFLMYNGFLNFENGFCLMRFYLLMDPVSCLSNKKMILSRVCPTMNELCSPVSPTELTGFFLFDYWTSPALGFEEQL